jgi:hypothetical protein
VWEGWAAEDLVADPVEECKCVRETGRGVDEQGDEAHQAAAAPAAAAPAVPLAEYGDIAQVGAGRPKGQWTGNDDG